VEQKGDLKVQEFQMLSIGLQQLTHEDPLTILYSMLDCINEFETIYNMVLATNANVQCNIQQTNVLTFSALK
jgi:hypothetical protein